MRLRFSGHQSFPLRYPWLPKAVAALGNDPQLFRAEDALVRLGVGKNMVDSIQHWADVCGVIEREGDAWRVTSFGQTLFGRMGVDPYLEQHATYWLLHWQLCSSLSGAAAWYLAFTKWNRSYFSKEDLVEWLLRVAAHEGGTRASRNSIGRDVDVLVRTYLTRAVKGRRAPEDSFDGPLTQLGLLIEAEPGVFEFRRGAHPTLSTDVLGYAIQEYWAAQQTTQETVSLDTLLHSEGSPGGAFQLSEQSISTLCQALPRAWGLTYDESAGMKRLVRERTLAAEERLSLLRSSYQSIGRAAA